MIVVRGGQLDRSKVANSSSSSRSRQLQCASRRRPVIFFCVGPVFAFINSAMKRVKSPIDLPGVVTSSRDVPGGHRISIELEAEREHVPGILLMPDRSTSLDNRCAAALLLHGFTSRKERMAEGIGSALLSYSVASLSIDLPMHGAREGRFDESTLRNPLQIVGTWRRALSEVRHSLDYLTGLTAVDPQRLAVVGYSLGAYLTVVSAADDARVRAI